jgi:hypothetical protein
MMNDPNADHRITDLRCLPGELSFAAHIGGVDGQIWFRTDSDVEPLPDAAIAACLMPAMRFGGTLSMPQPVSPKLLRNQREFQAIQRAWSREWTLGEPPLEEVKVIAPTRPREIGKGRGRVAAFFSGGVDSWSTILENEDLTDLIFVLGFDLLPNMDPHGELSDLVVARLRAAATEIGLALHVVETNVREFSTPLAQWGAYFGSATVAVALFLAPLFERVLIAGEADYETQGRMGVNLLVDRLWSTEGLEIVDSGGRYSRAERTARIASHPVVQKTLRVCWQNPDGAYNCGRCRKCLMTMITLEALGAREGIATFPPVLNLDALSEIELDHLVTMRLWEDVLDVVRAAGRPDLERVVEPVIGKGKRHFGLPVAYRYRSRPAPAPTVRIAVIVPVWRQAEYMAAAVQSALDQRCPTGVGVVIVNDGCPDPETDRIGQALRDAHPERVVYLHQPNRGISAARNAGIRRAFARWPHLEAVFPLDADNMLSPETLTELRIAMERHGAGWASPTLEFFGAEDGEWSMPKPYLPYRQLFTNQSDTGSLIHRSVFEAGIEFDETMRNGYEDWEFFLRATLAGFRGVHAGRCGFRYRSRPNSMLGQAKEESETLEAEVRRRHPDAFEPHALARREHAEAPRFGLVRCDADDVLLTAACDLEPHRVPLATFLRPRPQGNGVPPLDSHVPAMSVLATAATIEWLQAEGILGRTLLRLQLAVHDNAVVGLRALGRRGRPRFIRRRNKEPSSPVALAMRTRMLARIAASDEPLQPRQPSETVEVQTGRRRPPTPLPDALLRRTIAYMGAALPVDRPLIPKASHPEYFEYRHVDLLQTTPPFSKCDDAVDLLENLKA